MEFAIIAALLFLILFGIIQFGIALHRSQGLEAAAREGARISAIGATVADIRARVRIADSLFADADVGVTVDVEEGNAPGPVTSDTAVPCSLAGIGGLVRVRAQVLPNPAYAIVIPLWGNQEITYTSTGRFRCERAGG